MHKWAMGAGANYWMYTQFATIMLVYTTGFKLDPRLVGIALFFPRLVDGLIDPILGHLSDITHTKWGRRRPFLFMTTILGAFLVVAIWMPSTAWPQWMQCAWLTVGATLLFSTWGTYTMAHQALGYELSDDYNDRSRVFAILGVYAAIMSIGGGYYYWTAVQLGNGIHWPLKFAGWEWTLAIPSVGGEINGIRILSVFSAVMILICGFIPVFFCRERFVNANRTHVSLWQACLTTLKCRPFALILLMQIIRGLGLYSAFAGYIGIYYVCGGNKSLFLAAQQGLGGILGAVGAFTMWPLAKPLTRHIGKRWGIVLCSGISFLYAILLPFITIPGRIYLLVFTGFAFMFPNMLAGMFGSSIMPDICDIDELSSGERREGLFASVQSCISKWETSIAMLVSMWVLSLIGFDADLPQQSPAVLTRMLWWAFTPLIITTGVTFFIAFKIPVTEEFMNDVRARLEKRRAEAAAKMAVPGTTRNSSDR